MIESPVSFNSEDLMLEGIYRCPRGKGPFPAAVICHPHSLYGGSMHVPVIEKLAYALVEREIAALAFNFRGVGKSEGRFGAGIEEQKDVLAALKWLDEQVDVDGGRIGLAGYSFGGGVALEVACRTDDIKALALLAPSMVEPGADRYVSAAEKYVLGGAEDDMITPHNLRIVFERISGPKKLEIMDGADHYMAGYADLASEKMACFFTETLKR